MDIRNERVRLAIDRLRRAPDDAARADFDREVVNGALLLAVAEPPEGVEVGADGLTPATDLPALTTSTQDGRQAVVAFTDAEALRARAVESRIVAMAARDVLAMIADGKYDGLVLNPAGRWVGLTREDVLRILAAAA